MYSPSWSHTVSCRGLVFLHAELQREGLKQIQAEFLLLFLKKQEIINMMGEAYTPGKKKKKKRFLKMKDMGE